MPDGQFRFSIVEDNGNTYEKYFSQDVVTIGRSSEAVLVIQLAGISRIHAKVSHKDGLFFVEDNGSTNGTFLNDVAIIEKTPIHDGDVIKLGKSVTLGFYIQQEQETSPKTPPSPFEPVTLQDIAIEPLTPIAVPIVEEDLSWLDDESANAPQIVDTPASNPTNVVEASGYNTEVVLPLISTPSDNKEDVLSLDNDEDAFNPFAKSSTLTPVPERKQTQEQTPRVAMPAVMHAQAERPTTASTRPVTVTSTAPREYCLGCITLLTPADTRQGFNTFVQCDRCGKIYHEACWSGTCVRFSCGSTSAHSVSVAPPAPLAISEKRRSILPEGKIYIPSTVSSQSAMESSAPVSTPKAPSSVPKPPQEAPRAVVPKPPQSQSSPAVPPRVITQTGPSLTGDMVQLIRAWFWRIVFFLAIAIGSTIITFTLNSDLSLSEALDIAIQSLTRLEPGFVREVLLPTLLVMWAFYPRQLMGVNTSQSLGRRLMRFVGVAMALIFLAGLDGFLTDDFFERIQETYQNNSFIVTLQASMVALTLISTPIYRFLSGRRVDEIEIPDSLNWAAWLFSFVRFYAVAGIVMFLALGVAYELVQYLPAMTARLINGRFAVTLPVLNVAGPIGIFLIAGGIGLCAVLIYHPPVRNRYSNSHWWLRVLLGVGIAVLAFIVVQDKEMSTNDIASLMLLGAGSVLALLPMQRAFS